MTNPAEDFQAYRPLLFSIAYRMTGSASEAEDLVQDSYLRYRAAPKEDIRSLKSYLSTIITRLAIDHLKSAQARREQYVGPWLPEPLLTSDGNPLLQKVEQREMIASAFLVLLETLSPQERAVFLLREVFEYEYGQIAEVNGAPALLLFTGETLLSVSAFQVAGGRVHALQAVLNPDKLAYIRRQVNPQT